MPQASGTGKRRIQHSLSDVIATLLTGDQGYMAGNVDEQTIAAFCRRCDNLEKNGGCGVCNSNDQARYAARGSCGWASVKGVRGEMTEKRFKKH